MKKFTMFMMALAMVLAFGSNGTAALFYFEDFTTDPSFTLTDDTLLSGERFTWNSTDGVYEIRVYDEHDVYKYALTPEFSRVQATSFVIEVDLKPVTISYGQGMKIIFYDTDSNYDVSALSFSQGGNNNPNFRIGGVGMDTQQTSDTTLGTWYRIRVAYGYVKGTVDILITERDSEDIFYEKNGVPFAPSSFNRCAFGDRTLNAEGNWAEMHYDNISVKKTSVDFSDFTINKVKLDFNVEPTSDKVQVEGEFTVGEDNDGIYPLEEDVKLTVGNLDLLIPAYSFWLAEPGKFKFEGVCNEVYVKEAKIEETKDYGTYKFKVKIEESDLPTVSVNPLHIDLFVGDDLGKIDLLEGKVDF